MEKATDSSRTLLIHPRITIFCWAARPGFLNTYHENSSKSNIWNYDFSRNMATAKAAPNAESNWSLNSTENPLNTRFTSFVITPFWLNTLPAHLTLSILWFLNVVKGSISMRFWMRPAQTAWNIPSREIVFGEISVMVPFAWGSWRSPNRSGRTRKTQSSPIVSLFSLGLRRRVQISTSLGERPNSDTHDFKVDTKCERTFPPFSEAATRKYVPGNRRKSKEFVSDSQILIFHLVDSL